jgi:hypothetical protein
VPPPPETAASPRSSGRACRSGSTGCGSPARTTPSPSGTRRRCGPTPPATGLETHRGATSRTGPRWCSATPGRSRYVDRVHTFDVQHGVPVADVDQCRRALRHRCHLRRVGSRIPPQPRREAHPRGAPRSVRAASDRPSAKLPPRASDYPSHAPWRSEAGRLASLDVRGQMRRTSTSASNPLTEPKPRRMVNLQVPRDGYP